MSGISIKDKSYKIWLEALKSRIRSSQIKAAVKVNSELLDLYWHLGEEIVHKQKEGNWGEGIIDQLSKDLMAAFPGMQGFSRPNLFFIRKWFLFYNNKVSQVVRQVASNEALDYDIAFVSQLVRQIPWGHNREIVAKTDSLETALFYVQETIRNSWSRAVLLIQIESQLHKRAGGAIHNFRDTLPPIQADLARETLKNPYNFDFLTIGTEARERDLERALIDHVQKFLLELGQLINRNKFAIILSLPALNKINAVKWASNNLLHLCICRIFCNVKYVIDRLFRFIELANIKLSCTTAYELTLGILPIKSPSPISNEINCRFSAFTFTK